MKIDYKKNFGNDGTVYRQTIKIDKWLKEYYNNYLLKLKIKTDENYFKNHSYSEKDLKIKSIEYLENGINYTNLIQLDVFLQVINELNNNGYNFNFKRLLWRNTIIIVIQGATMKETIKKIIHVIIGILLFPVVLLIAMATNDK